MSTPSYRTESPVPDTRVKIPHLVIGVVLLGLAAVWALVHSGLVDADTLPVLGPALLIVAGVAGLVGSLVSSRKSRDREL